MKMAKSVVNYAKGMPGAHCSICEHYRGGTCRIVDGVINPDMWCLRFAKTKEAA